MNGRAYYNEIDRYAAAWLRNLIAAGHIAPGDVDERDIRDVVPTDVAGYTQCHWFAGIGGWSLALRLAGWPDDRPVWTGSCPCQPFSPAGRGAGVADERHLWPSWFWLIAQCRPDRIYGEQVTDGSGLAWFDLVRPDLEGIAYACGGVDLPAAGVGAWHRRQRLWWLADADPAGLVSGAASRLHAPGESGHDDDGRGAPCDLADAERSWGGARQCGGSDRRPAVEPDRHGTAGVLGDARGGRSTGDAGTDVGAEAAAAGRGDEYRGDGDQPEPASVAGELGDAGRERLPAREREGLREPWRGEEGRATEQPSDSPWAAAEWIACRDGVSRPVEPGSFPLAHGVSARVGRLRAYGNAVVPQVAAAFIRATM